MRERQIEGNTYIESCICFSHCLFFYHSMCKCEEEFVVCVRGSMFVCESVRV